MGYTAEGNGKKGKNYRIIITKAPQLIDVMDIFKKIGLSYSEDNLEKVIQLLSSLGGSANYSYRSLENYNYFTDKTIKKYLEIFEKMKMVKLTLTDNIYYATKKRELTYEEINYTPEEVAKQDYYYVIDVKSITADEYNKAVKAYLDFIEEHKHDDEMVPDEIEFYAHLAKKDVLRGWVARKNTGERYEISPDFPQLDTITPLLVQQDKQGYQRVKKGNHIEDELRWEERKERWEQEKEKRKADREMYESLKKQVEQLKAMLNEQQLAEFEKLLQEDM